MTIKSCCSILNRDGSEGVDAPADLDVPLWVCKQSNLEASMEQISMIGLDLAV